MTLTDKLEKAVLAGTGCVVSAAEVKAIFSTGAADVAFAARLQILKDMHRRIPAAAAADLNSSP